MTRSCKKKGQHRKEEARGKQHGQSTKTHVSCGKVDQITARKSDRSVRELAETQESVTTNERREDRPKHQDDGRAGPLSVL